MAVQHAGPQCINPGGQPHDSQLRTKRATHNNHHTCGTCRAKRYCGASNTPRTAAEGPHNQATNAACTRPAPPPLAAKSQPEHRKNHQVATTQGGQQEHPQRLQRYDKHTIASTLDHSQPSKHLANRTRSTQAHQTSQPAAHNPGGHRQRTTCP